MTRRAYGPFFSPLLVPAKSVACPYSKGPSTYSGQPWPLDKFSNRGSRPTCEAGCRFSDHLLCCDRCTKRPWSSYASHFSSG